MARHCPPLTEQLDFVRMDTWPLPNIPPELFDTLTDDERRTLEALTQTYLAHVELRRAIPDD